MKKSLFLSAALLTAVACQNALADHAGFDPDYDAARERAKANGRQMFVLFTGSDWCGWCIRLNEEVFSKNEFLSVATNEFEMVVLDYPNDKSKQTDAQRKRCRELSDKFSVNGFPTVLIIDPKDESVVHTTGYEAGGAVKWLEKLHSDIKYAKVVEEKLGGFQREFARQRNAIGKALRSAPRGKKTEAEINAAINEVLKAALPGLRELAGRIEKAEIPSEIEPYRAELFQNIDGAIKYCDGLISKTEAK